MPGFVAGEATYRTRRTQIAVAAGTGAIALLLALGAVFGARDRLAHSNNIPARTQAASLQPGDRMCRESVVIPEGSTGLQLHTLTYGAPGPPVRLGLRTPGTVIRSEVEGGYPDASWTTIPFDRVSSSTSGTACVTNVGSRPVAFSGVIYTSEVGSPLRLNGKRQPSDLAIQVEAERESLAGLAPTIFGRAAVWAPGFVGGWTYWLIVLFGVAATVLAVRLVLVGGPPARRWRGLPRAAWAIAALALVNGLAWAVLTPPWPPPAEIAHFPSA